MAKFNVIGLGSIGCSIASNFAQYPQYRVYKIGTDLKKGKYNHILPNYDNPEDYEKNIPKLKTFFRLVQDDVLFIVGGGCSESIASLVTLKQIEHCNITILYVQPDSDFLVGEIGKKIDRLVFNVLQEYARSAVFNKIYLVKYEEIGNILGDIPIKEYFKQVNSFISSTLHMIHIFQNSSPIVSNLISSDEIERIVTYGIMDFESGKENLIFPIDNVSEKCYYYALSSKRIEEDSRLFNTIREQIKSKRKGKTKILYAVYSTEYEEDFVFITAKSSKIQLFNREKK